MGQQKIFFTTHMWSIGLSVSAIHYVFFFPFSNAYCLLCVFQVCTHNLKFARLPDPYRGEDVTRLTKNGRILLPPNGINPCIEFFYKLSLGDGAVKLVKRISEHYFGISKNHVISFLNAHPVHSKANPSFKNKAPLQPIKAQYILFSRRMLLFKVINIFLIYASVRVCFCSERRVSTLLPENI